MDMRGMQHILSTLAALVAVGWPMTGLAEGLEQAQAQKLADAYVAGRDRDRGDPQATHESGKVVVADLDGDGQDEIVVLWTMLGPTYWAHGVTVLARQGGRYLPSGETQEPLGSVEGMEVKDAVIQLKTKWPGPNDPRCCPSLEKTLRYRWSPGRLTPLK